jgi:hypothetical protein
MRMWAILALAALCAGVAWPADLAFDPGPVGAVAPGGDETDAGLELKYDTGTRSYLNVSFYGEDHWYGCDFDISQFSEYRGVTRIRVFSDPGWPQPGWDGFNVAIFEFVGTVPGSVLWGPKFIKPRRTTPGWVRCKVNWTLPAGNDRFVAAMEQYYDYPECDCFATDDNLTASGHSWQYVEDSWAYFGGNYGYKNIMLRVVVDNVTVRMTPTSLGRIKGLYY